MTADEIGQMLKAASADTEPLRERVAELEPLPTEPYNIVGRVG